MRAALAVVLATIVVSGCGHGQVGSSPSAIAKPTPSVAGSTPFDDWVPPDDPSLPHKDRAGHTPDDVVRAHFDAVQRHDWRAAYALYAKPWLSYEHEVEEWIEADESYLDFAVLETRVIGEGKAKGDAMVRVTYTYETTLPGGQRHTVVREVTGVWLLVVKVNGLWKYNYSQG